MCRMQPYQEVRLKPYLVSVHVARVIFPVGMLELHVPEHKFALVKRQPAV